MKLSFLILFLLWATSLQAQVASPSFSSLRFPVNTALIAKQAAQKKGSYFKVGVMDWQGAAYNSGINHSLVGIPQSFEVSFSPDKKGLGWFSLRQQTGSVEILPISDITVYTVSLPVFHFQKPTDSFYSLDWNIGNIDYFPESGVQDNLIGTGVSIPFWGNYSFGYYVPSCFSLYTLKQRQYFYAISGVHWNFLRWEYGRQYQNFFYPNEPAYGREGWYGEVEVKLWKSMILGYKETKFNDSGPNAAQNRRLLRWMVGVETSWGPALLAELIQDPAQPLKDFVRTGAGWQF